MAQVVTTIAVALFLCLPLWGGVKLMAEWAGSHHPSQVSRFWPIPFVVFFLLLFLLELCCSHGRAEPHPGVVGAASGAEDPGDYTNQ